MKKKILLIIFLFLFGFYFRLSAQNSPPIAINDTAHTVPGWGVFVNVLDNDFDPDGDSIFISCVFGPNTYIDSIVHIPFGLSYLPDYYKGYKKVKYCLSDTIPWYESFDTATIVVYFDEVYFYSFLDINNVNGMFNCFGNHFWEMPLGDGPKYFVPNGGTKTSLFTNTFWIGGLDETGDLHLATERYRQDGPDYFQGPVSNTYDSVYDAEWFRIWKLTNEEIEYHVTNWREGGYEPIENIASWPGKGNPEMGQSEQIAPYYDNNNDGVYDPMEGDYPMIKGDQALFFVFNDDRNIHMETEGIPLGIEIRAMAYAFNEPTDSALWHTTFLHYEIENRSDTIYNETYIGICSDINIGNGFDDYIGCNVQDGFYYGYNGDEWDDHMDPVWGDSITYNYGYHPPAQAVMILGGPYMDDDGIDNPKYDENNQQICDMSINGLNFSDTIIDNERLGMTRFFYYQNFGPPYSIDPFDSSDYLNYLNGIWKDGTQFMYGGTGHQSSGAVGPECNFIFPGDSDTCNWGTNGILPNGGYNQNGLYWTEEQVENNPGDRRGLGVSGPFTFEPGDVHEVDIAFVWARDYDGDPWSSAELLEEYCASIREKFINDPDFFSGMNYYRNQSSQMLLYPNPVIDELTIKLPDYFEQGNLTIFDISGTKITNIEISDSQKIVINTTHFKNGLYIVRVFDGSLNYISKFIKK